MRRRTNKSAKVPNVKLRPAPAGALSRTSSDRFLVPNTQLDSDDTAYADSCPQPLEHLIICATGIKDKPTVFKKAAELGASHVNAFTDKVTHLIADTHGGAKYMCALERKIPIMKSSWVEESFDIWLKGDDVDLEESLIVHRLPVFSGVVLCLSGITDLERRLQINKLVTQNGGTYVKNLERPVRVTHLLCSGDEETDKMRYAAKFNKRKEANIHLVWEEWFWDSLEFGGRFDEATYQMSRPRPERKAQPDIASSPPPSEFISEMDDTLEKRPKPQTQSSNQDGEDEVANVKILPAVTLQIWGSLLNRRGYEVSGTELVRTTSAPAALFRGARATDGGDNDEFHTPDIQQPGKSVISAFRRTTSFAPVKSLESEGSGSGAFSSVTSRQQPFRRTTTSTNANKYRETGTPVPETNGDASTSAAIHEPVAGPSNFPANAMFAGYGFRALGEAKTQAVKNAVESYGGRMVNEWDEEVDFIIVRLVSGSKLYREEVDSVLRSKYRTECWLERCIFEDKVCPPDADISFTPLAIETPILGAENIVLSISGLDQSESCALRRLLRALGITLAPTFSRRTTHLLCPSGVGQKFEKACEWGKPVVGMTWLALMASTGCIPPVEEHLVSRSTTPAVGGGGGNSSKFDFGLPAEIDVKGKGKGKAVPQDLAPIDVGAKMNNITNTDNSESPSELPHHHPSSLPSRKHQLKPNLQTSRSSSSSTSSSLSFGQPRHGLGESAAQGVSPASLPPRSGSPSSSPASALPLRFQQSRSSESFTQSFNTSPNTNSSNEAPKPTWQQLEQERLTANIPSSRTPSPLKLVGVAAKQGSNGSGSGNRASVSPVKIDHEVTTALQESITRALKRHTSEEDDVLNTGRSSKRQRPQRRKAPTRQASERDITDISSVDLNPIPLMPFVGSTISPFESFEITESDMLPVVELTTATVGGTKKLGKLTNRRGRNVAGVRESVIPEELEEEEEEDSVRVVYEDPGVADERKKLMKLFKGRGRESPSRVVGTASSSVRRGTRTRKSTK